MLTDTAIRPLKPGPRPIKKSDGGSLFILVTSEGSKHWRLAYRFFGKQKLLSGGPYSLAMALHVSGPVTMAVAGLLIGNAGLAHAMSDTTQDYLLKFWALIDEVLNAVLFLLIELEVIAIAPEWPLLAAGLGAILLVLAARAISLGVPLALMKRRIDMGPLALPTLVWGGLRGGISVALALSLPESPTRTAILAATYVVVLFAVIVQGGTISGLIARIKRRAEVAGQGPA